MEVIEKPRITNRSEKKELVRTKGRKSHERCVARHDLAAAWCGIATHQAVVCAYQVIFFEEYLCTIYMRCDTKHKVNFESLLLGYIYV